MDNGPRVSNCTAGIVWGRQEVQSNSIQISVYFFFWDAQDIQPRSTMMVVFILLHQAQCASWTCRSAKRRFNDPKRTIIEFAVT